MAAGRTVAVLRVWTSFAIDTACAIFTRIREVPCAAASHNHSAAPSPMPQERGLGRPCAGSGSRLIAPAGAGREMRVVDRGLPGPGPVVAGDLDRAAVTDVHDDHLLVPARRRAPAPTPSPRAGGAAPSTGALEGHHRGVHRHRPGLPERDGVRQRRDRVQTVPFLSSMSAGTRLVVRCTRPLTVAMNARTPPPGRRTWRTGRRGWCRWARCRPSPA